MPHGLFAYDLIEFFAPVSRKWWKMKNFVIKVFLVALICLLLGYLTRHYRIEIVRSEHEVRQTTLRDGHFITNKTARATILHEPTTVWAESLIDVQSHILLRSV